MGALLNRMASWGINLFGKSALTAFAGNLPEPGHVTFGVSSDCQQVDGKFTVTARG
jgi:hypothetical protein